MLSTGSACYLFWKKCAPATPVHAALLRPSQVFRAATRSSRDISRPLAETTAREIAFNCHVRVVRTRYTRLPRVAWYRGGDSQPISFMRTRTFYFIPRTRARLRARSCTCTRDHFRAPRVRIVLLLFLTWRNRRTTRHVRERSKINNFPCNSKTFVRYEIKKWNIRLTNYTREKLTIYTLEFSLVHNLNATKRW